jgi:hypothetical protein
MTTTKLKHKAKQKTQSNTKHKAKQKTQNQSATLCLASRVTLDVVLRIARLQCNSYKSTFSQTAKALSQTKVFCEKQQLN